jgi:hypothetical protein
MAPNALGIIVHDLLSGFIPEMSIIGALTNADLAVDAQVLVSLNAKLMIVFIYWLEQQNRHPLSFVAKKVIFYAIFLEQILKILTIWAYIVTLFRF